MRSNLRAGLLTVLIFSVMLLSIQLPILQKPNIWPMEQKLRSGIWRLFRWLTEKLMRFVMPLPIGFTSRMSILKKS
ncbi:hypothetical protein ACFP3I_11930 [Chryseobacterium arachidis]|uniref:hypothetical protein n=1 Tax=Chryseobacterium arachidis TaxID=1416778 RepID=UPI0036073404